MGHRFLCLLVIFLVAVATRTCNAGLLFGAVGGNTQDAHLYVLNPATGAFVTDVGSLVDGSNAHFAVTGLAFDPANGTLYGASSSVSPTLPGYLVQIDPGTAVVTTIGAFDPVFGTPMTDLTFNPQTGVLYGWSGTFDHALYSVNTFTGIATKVGTDVRLDSGGGGLAANASGTLFVTPDGVRQDTSTTPTLRTTDKITGDTTIVAPLSTTTGSLVINALAF